MSESGDLARQSVSAKRLAGRDAAGSLLGRGRCLLGCVALLIVGPGLLLAAWLGAWSAWVDHNRPTQLDGELVSGAQSGLQSTAARVGEFEIAWDHDARRLSIQSLGTDGRELWSSLPGRSFVGGAVGRGEVEEERGSFFVDDERGVVCPDQTVESLAEDGGLVLLSGRLLCPEVRQDGVPYVLRFEAEEPDRLRFVLRLVESELNRAFLTFAMGPEERAFGFGVRYSQLDFRGRRVPILVQEQGIGRGAQPVTLGADLTARAGGSWRSTYAPVPHLLTSRPGSLALASTELSSFDLRRDDRVQIEVWSSQIEGVVFAGSSPSELVQAYTAWAGRMRRLPEWIHKGAVVGMQGGTEAVREKLARLREAGTPVAAVWLQDWVGQRTTSFGQQLWWNWQLDRDHYPDWDELVAELDAQGIRVLTYVNPFLVDVDEREGWTGRNLYREAAGQGFLVQRDDGAPYLVKNTDFDAGLLDLTHPGAVDWFRQILRDEVMAVGASGWMADFAEGLPFDAVLHSGRDAATMHNRWPELWAELNRSVLDGKGGDDTFFFTRSGFTRSPAHSTLFWLGDQMVSWDEHDGLKTVVTGLVSSGLSGFTLQHADLGGYTTINHPVMNVHRDLELLQRWAELSAFTVVYRSHEGNRPDENVQPWTNDAAANHFARFARVYAAWSGERQRLIEEAYATGLPVVRHPWLCFPDDPASVDLTRQFMVGCDLVVAPVMDPGVEWVDVHLPPGDWTHVWSGIVYQGPMDLTVDAPLGEPGVFARSGSEMDVQIRASPLSHWAEGGGG